MSGFWNKSRIVVAALALSVAGVTPLFAQVTPPAAPPAGPATMPAADAPIAVIDGREINNAAFYHLMMQIAGMRVFQQVFDLTLVQRACSVGGIAIQGDEFEARLKAEYQRTLDGMNLPSTVKDEQKPQILEEVLRRQGVTAVEFRMGLERQAGLRALAKGKVEVTDKDLEDQYQADYGEKVDVKIINVGTTEKAAALRPLIEGSKKTPEAAAADLSLPAPQAATISKNATGIDALRDVAFLVNEKALSAPIDFNNQKFMIYVEKKQASQTGTVTKASVTAKLKEKIQATKETNWMNQHLARLRAEAVVKINDPVLSAQFALIAEQIKRQQEAASTQPGAAGVAPAATATKPK